MDQKDPKCRTGRFNDRQLRGCPVKPRPIAMMMDE